MNIFTRDASTDHMNYIQFADACWLADMNYAAYVKSAEACGKSILTEAQYKSQCDSNDAQAKEYIAE